MWANLGKWLAKFVLVPLLIELAQKWREEQREKKQKEKDIKEALKRAKEYEDAKTSKEADDAFNDLTK